MIRKIEELSSLDTKDNILCDNLGGINIELNTKIAQLTIKNSELNNHIKTLQEELITLQSKTL